MSNGELNIQPTSVTIVQTLDGDETHSGSDEQTAPSNMEEEECQSNGSLLSSDESVETEDERDETVIEDMKKLEANFTGISERFRLVNRIGEGTFSTVYKAEDLFHDSYGDYNIQDQTDSSSIDFPDYNFNLHKRRRLNGGKTQKTKRNRPNRFVALKKIYVTSSPSRIYNELEIMLALRDSPSVCKIITAFRSDDQVVAALPYFPHVDFRVLYRTFLVEDMRHYLHSLLTALCGVHAKGILHRDIKPTNFLYNPKLRRGILVDFGLAEWEDPSPPICDCDKLDIVNLIRSRPQKNDKEAAIGYPKNDSRPSRRANRAGTRGFRAPEVLFKCPAQTTKIDIWSVGVVLLSLVGRRFPFFHSLDDIDAMIEISSIFGTRRMKRAAALHGQVFETNIPTIGEKGYSLEKIVQWSSCVSELTGREQQAVRLLSGLLELDPEHRLSAKDALKHSFFTRPEGLDLPWGGDDNDCLKEYYNKEAAGANEDNDETTHEGMDEVQLV